MAEQKTKKETTNVVEKHENYTISHARVKNVLISKYDTKRVSLQLDKTFVSFDEKGEYREDADTLGINIFNLLQQTNDNMYVSMINSLAMGRNVNPQIVAILFNNATISVDRVFKEKGEDREYDKGTYENDCYTSVISEYKPNLNEFQIQWLTKLMDTKLVVEEKTADVWD